MLPSSQAALCLLGECTAKLIAVDCLRRPEVAALCARGSGAYVYGFMWTGKTPNGWAASPQSLIDCEQRESLSHLLYPDDPVLRLHSGSKIQRDDIFYDGSGVRIIRLALSPILSDITLIEKTIHTLTAADSVGFIGHLKNGGSPARQESYVYGCSLLVIPDLETLNLQVEASCRGIYAAELQYERLEFIWDIEI